MNDVLESTFGDLEPAQGFREQEALLRGADDEMSEDQPFSSVEWGLGATTAESVIHELSQGVQSNIAAYGQAQKQGYQGVIGAGALSAGGLLLIGIGSIFAYKLLFGGERRRSNPDYSHANELARRASRRGLYR